MENILQIADLTKRYPDFYLDHLTLNVPSGSIVGLIGENGAGKTTTMNLILNAVTKDSGDILVFGQDNLSHEKEVKMNFAIALAHHAELLLLDEATSGLDPVMRDDVLDLLLDFVQSEKHGVLFSTHIMSDLSKIADYIAFLHEGKLLFFKSKDELIYRYGLIHCGEKLFREIDRGDILAWRKQDYEYQILVADREAAARKYKGCVLDPATLDDIMLLYIKGGSL